MKIAIKLASIALMGTALLTISAAPAWAPRFGRLNPEEGPAVASVGKIEWDQIKRIWKRTGKWAECNKEALTYKGSGRSHRSLVAACLKAS